LQENDNGFPWRTWLLSSFGARFPIMDQRGHLNRKLRFGDCHLLVLIVITETLDGAVL
jgi:hypothetical protein